jgi:hypothetical protein
MYLENVTAEQPYKKPLIIIVWLELIFLCQNFLNKAEARNYLGSENSDSGNGLGGFQGWIGSNDLA